VSSAAPSPAKGKKGKTTKKPFWQMELGRKKGVDLADDEVEHPPFVATLPRVNLLPESVRQSLAMRRVRRVLAAVIVLLVLVGGGVWYLQGTRIADAEQRLADARATGAQLQTQVAALAPITVLTTALADQKALVDATLAGQPQSAVVIERVEAARRAASDGGGIGFSNIAVTYQGVPAAGGPLNSCPNPDPFGTEATIGCLTFDATAGNRQEVSRLLEVLEADSLFVGPYVTSTALSQADEAGTPGVTFSGTAGVSLEGLDTLLTPEQIEAIVNPPLPEATETEEGSQ
jgi:hypothetical protein